MRYALLINTDEAIEPQPGQPGYGDHMAAYGAFTQGIIASGAYVAGERLRPVGTAKTVRVRDGKQLITDGPFAETRERLGGYYVVDCKSVDEAIGHAANIPGAQFGSVEVRPIWEMGAD